MCTNYNASVCEYSVRTYDADLSACFTPTHACTHAHTHSPGSPSCQASIRESCTEQARVETVASALEAEAGRLREELQRKETTLQETAARKAELVTSTCTTYIVYYNHMYSV